MSDIVTYHLRDSLVAQMVEKPPAMQKMWVQSLGGEDPLEEEIAIHSRILAWEIPWTAKVLGVAKSRTQLSVILSFSILIIKKTQSNENQFK